MKNSNFLNIRYNANCALPSDINAHLPTLKKYAERCEHITELGVRGIVSTWAFLMGMPKTLISVDIVNPETIGHNLQEVYDCAKDLNIDFKFILGNDLEIELEQTDLMFIDTLHTYDHLKKELTLLSSKVNKYIILHDTVAFGIQGEDNGKGLLQAMIEFLKENKNWKIEEQFFYNNGLTILSKQY